MVCVRVRSEEREDWKRVCVPAFLLSYSLHLGGRVVPTTWKERKKINSEQQQKWKGREGREGWSELVFMLVLIAFERRREGVQFVELLVVVVLMVLSTFERREWGGRERKAGAFAQLFCFCVPMPCSASFTIIQQQHTQNREPHATRARRESCACHCLCVVLCVLCPSLSKPCNLPPPSRSHHQPIITIISPLPPSPSTTTQHTASLQHVWQSLREAVQGHPGLGGLAPQASA